MSNVMASDSGWSAIVSAGFVDHSLSVFLEGTAQKEQYLADLKALSRGERESPLIHRLVTHLRFRPTLLLRLNAFIGPKYRLECSRTCEQVDFYVLVEGRKPGIHPSTGCAVDTALLSSYDDVLNAIARPAAWDGLIDPALPHQWLESFAQVLQEILDDVTVASSYKGARKLLTRLAKEQSIIPPSVFFDFHAVGLHNPKEMVAKLESVGFGGCCDIYRVGIDNSSLCIRSIRLTLGDNFETIRQSFCKEVVIWRQLKHPNVAQLLGVAMDVSRSHRLCFIMPWYPFGSLRSFLQQNLDHDKHACVVQIVNGVSYLHGLDPPVIHKDLKTANVLVDHDGNCVLSDFGISKALDTLVTNSKGYGTQLWMAPEEFNDEHEPMEKDGRPRDVYSLGCTIYEILTLCYPSSIWKCTVKGNAPSLPPPGNWSHQERNLWNVVEKCVVVAPSERPSISSIFSELRMPSFVNECRSACDNVVIEREVLQGGSEEPTTIRSAANKLDVWEGVDTTVQYPPTILNSDSDSTITQAGRRSSFERAMNITTTKESETTSATSETILPRIDSKKKRGSGVVEHIIAILGYTGAGKSKIIDNLAHTSLAGTGLKPVTNRIMGVRTVLKRNGHVVKVTLLDTPGFDRFEGLDSDTLLMIMKHLHDTYPKGAHLSGILYVHRITSNRMSPPPHFNLQLLGELLGGEAEIGKRTVFVTTMWDRVDPHIGAEREGELHRALRPILTRGSQLKRQANTRKDATQLILDLVESVGPPAPVRPEKVNRHLSFQESVAAKGIYTPYQQSLMQEKAFIEDLQRRAHSTANDGMDLKVEMARIEADLQKSFGDKQVTLGQRFTRFFQGTSSPGR